MSDENEYLKEGFEYSKLTIPVLRGILHKHEVPIPAHTTRKAEFIKLYESNILPQLKTLRRQYLHANPSSENIHDASPRSRSASPVRRSTRLRSQSPAKRVTSQGSAASRTKRALAPPDESATAAAVPESPRRRKINKKVALPNDLEELAPNVGDVQFRGGPRTRSRSPARESVTKETKSPRRRRAPPADKTIAEVEEPRGRTPRREPHAAATKSSPFSNDNIFQRKRTSEHLEDRPAKAVKETKEEPKIEEEVDVMAQFTNFSETEQLAESKDIEIKVETPVRPRAAERRGFMPSLQALNVSNIFAQRLAPDPVSTPETSMPPTESENDADVEEVTTAPPEEEEETAEPEGVAEESADDTIVLEEPQLVVKRNVQHQFVSAVNAALVGFTALVILTLLVWWPIEHLKQGYCDTTLVPPARAYPWFASFSPNDAHLQQVQDYVRQGVDYIAPGCMECPEHATCYAGTQLECAEGFVERRTLGALLGYTGPTCERDRELERVLATLAERAVHVLRHRRARFECDGDIPSPIMSEDELYSELLALKAPQLSEEQFKELWEVVSGGLSEYPDVEMVFPRDCPPANGCAEDDDGAGCDRCPPTLFVSHSLAHVNILCRFKLSVLTWLEARKAAIAYVACVLAFFSVASSFVVVRTRRRRQVRGAVDEAIAKLRAQQQRADNDRTGRTDRFCVAQPLLGAVAKGLRGEVDSVLQRHKNVAYGQKEIKQGEIATIYEWTGL